ncbi:hypothetical protein RYB01_10855 [Pseudomonas syringae]|nr:hypothetical protein [Pseudomonas syringae]
MPILLGELTSYLEVTLGVEAHLSPDVKTSVAYHIKDAYTLFNLIILIGGKHRQSKLEMLLLLPVDDEYPGSVALGKHIAQVQKNTDKVVVYVCRSLSVSERRSLINSHINFIQPGYQLFIPELAMDMRESVRTRRAEGEMSALLPAAQAMLLGRLYEGWASGTLFTSNAIMGEFSYSRVTLAKVIDQLLKLGILELAQSDGFKNLYSFPVSPAGVFKKARHFMRPPARRKVAINTMLCTGDGVFLAGESALARLTMLADPAQPVFGMTKKQFDTLLEDNAFKVAESVDESRAWVEIWAYESLKKRREIADEASLLLSLKDSPDERIQLALDELKENVTWLKFED